MRRKRGPTSVRQVARTTLALTISIILASILMLWMYNSWYYRIDTDTDSIAQAIFAIGKYRNVSDEELINAMASHGDVNGFSRKYQCTFLYAAVTHDRKRLVHWLLRNGANPNPRGPHPLVASIVSGDAGMSRQLLRAGSSWNAEIEPGTTVLEAASQQNPQLVELLRRDVGP